MHDAGAESLFDLTEDASHHVELSNIAFDQGSGGEEAWQGMYIAVNGVSGGRPVLLHHLRVDIRSSSRRAIRFHTNGGVLFDCNLRRDAGPYPCWDTYPAPHQLGQGDDGSADVLDVCICGATPAARTTTIPA